MEKQKIMYAFNDESKWKKILFDAEEMLGNIDIVDKIAIVAMDTAILSTLSSTILTDLKEKINDLSNRGIDFYLCGDTMHKYGITVDMVLPQFKIAPRGTDVKILELKQAGYILFTTTYI